MSKAHTDVPHWDREYHAFLCVLSYSFIFFKKILKFLIYWYSPVLLGRTVEKLDFRSVGRFIIFLGSDVLRGSTSSEIR